MQHSYSKRRGWWKQFRNCKLLHRQWYSSDIWESRPKNILRRSSKAKFSCSCSITSLKKLSKGTKRYMLRRSSSTTWCLKECKLWAETLFDLFSSERLPLSCTVCSSNCMDLQSCLTGIGKHTNAKCTGAKCLEQMITTKVDWQGKSLWDLPVTWTTDEAKKSWHQMQRSIMWTNCKIERWEALYGICVRERRR